MTALRVLILALALVFPLALGAVTPEEQLTDPALEARAREISKVLRCPECQSETIDESAAPISADLRRLVRERLLAGDTDGQVIDYITARYGEFVLFKPQARGINLILWTAAPVLLLLALAVALAAARQRRAAAAGPAALSADEAARLEELTRK
jgi:cytochrome c-type biogenesis protein CcmH